MIKIPLSRSKLNAFSQQENLEGTWRMNDKIFHV